MESSLDASVSGEADVENDADGMATTATELGHQFGVEVEVVEDASKMTGRQRSAKGWFDTKTGKVVVIPGNHTSVADIRATVLHEIVGGYLFCVCTAPSPKKSLCRKN